MRGIRTLQLLIILGIGIALVVACAPTDPSTSSSILGDQLTPVAGATPPGAAASVTPRGLAARTPGETGTPLPADVQAIQQQLREMHLDMLQLHQAMMQLTPEQRRQLFQKMPDLMRSAAQFMTSMQLVMDQMTPDERQAMDEIVQQMRTDVQDMRRCMMMGTPGPMGTPGMMPMMPDTTPGIMPMYPAGTPGTPVPGGGPEMADMCRQMEQVHQQMLGQMQQMDLQQMQCVMAAMVDMVANMDLMIDLMGPAISRLTPEQRQQLLQQAQQMRGTIQQMTREIQSMPRTPSPVATDTPGTSKLRGKLIAIARRRGDACIARGLGDACVAPTDPPLPIISAVNGLVP